MPVDREAWLLEVAAVLEELPDGDARWLHDRCRVLVESPGAPAEWWAELADSLADYARPRRSNIPVKLLADMPTYGPWLLSVHLLHLEALAFSLPDAPPWDGVLVSPRALPPIDGGTISIDHGVLLPRRRFVREHAGLLERGYAWLNLAVVGVLADDLIVQVETPSFGNSGAGRTSVNLSGPTRLVRRLGWKLDDVLEVSR